MARIKVIAKDQVNIGGFKFKKCENQIRKEELEIITTKCSNKEFNDAGLKIIQPKKASPKPEKTDDNKSETNDAK